MYLMYFSLVVLIGIVFKYRNSEKRYIDLKIVVGLTNDDSLISLFLKYIRKIRSWIRKMFKEIQVMNTIICILKNGKIIRFLSICKTISNMIKKQLNYSLGCTLILEDWY